MSEVQYLWQSPNRKIALNKNKRKTNEKQFPLFSLDIFSQKHGIFCIFWGDCTRRTKEWGAFNNFSETHLRVSTTEWSNRKNVTYNKGTFLIDDTVKTHVCMNNVVWYINNSNMCYHAIPVFHRCMNSTCTQTATVARAVAKTTAGGTFFNIETSHFWRCGTRKTEAERSSCWFSWTEFPWLSLLGDYESKDSKIKGFKEERISKMGLCKNPCLSN